MEEDLPRSVMRQEGWAFLSPDTMQHSSMQHHPPNRYDYIDELFNTDCKMGKKVMMACGLVNAGKSLPDNLLLAWGPRDVLKHTGFFDI